MISLFFRNSEIRYRIFICLFLFLISGCAQLDGIFPKLKPQSDEETFPAAHNTATVAAEVCCRQPDYVIGTSCNKSTTQSNFITP